MAIARVQSKTGSVAGGTSISVTLDAAPSNGNALVLAFGSVASSAGRVSSISQTGVTWVKATEAANGSTPEAEIWYGLNASSASASITVNLAASLTAFCVVAEYSGIATSGALDRIASDTGSDGGAAESGSTAITTYTIELWVSALMSTDCSGTYLAPGNGFSEVAQVGSGVSVLALEEKIVSSTGIATTSATWSISTDAELWAGVIATLSDPTFTKNQRVFMIS